MKKQFDLHKYFRTMLTEAAEEEMQQQQQTMPPQPPEQTPQQQAQQQQQKAPAQDQAFRSLQGQTIAGVSFSPNGSTGGVIKIKVKNSHVPFTISWANQQVTVTDLQGNTLTLSDNQQ